MSNAHHFLPPEQWCAGPAECLACTHEWAAVWPLGAAPLECPNCNSTDTDRTMQ